MLRIAVLFVVTLVFLVGATLFLAFSFQQQRYENIAVALAIAVWTVAAYAAAHGVVCEMALHKISATPQCASCSYDLTANESGVCPECGTNIDPLKLLEQFRRLGALSDRSVRRALSGKRVLLGGMLCAVLLVTFFALAANSRNPRRAAVPDSMLASDFPMAFATWKLGEAIDESELRSFYGFIGPKKALRVSFMDDSHSNIESISVYDWHGRAWIDVELAQRRTHVYEYSDGDSLVSPEPIATFIDRDVDGFADARVDWSSGERLCRDGEVVWAKCTLTP